MKQRIRVVGLIKNKDGVLVLKRSQGRSDSLVFWELPTGKIKFGEQPEEAMVRSLTEYTGLVANNVKLKDVITFLAPEGESSINNLYIVYELEIREGIRPNPRERYTAYKFINGSDNFSVRLNSTSLSVLEIENAKIGERTISRDVANAVSIYVDGASRGNPGPSGIGFCVYGGDGGVTERGGEFIGFASSRVAEYLAMRKGVEYASKKGIKSVRFVSDSLMVVNQLNGVFKIKNQDIIPIYNDIQEMLSAFEAVTFVHVPREENRVADSEANRAIDRALK